MRTLDFVTKESLRRRRKSLAGLLFILLATGIFVACQTINKALHDKAKEQLLRFGANILVRPKGAMSDAVSDAVGGGDCSCRKDTSTRFIPSNTARCWWPSLLNYMNDSR